MQIDPTDPSRTYNAVFDKGFAGFNRTLVQEICRDPDNTPVMCSKLCPTEPMYQPGEESRIGENYDMV
eukprot:COSAG02_NODE_63072_length_264_cov_0.630303_1_plen_67_part_10